MKLRTTVWRDPEEIELEVVYTRTYDHGERGSLSCNAGWIIELDRVVRTDTKADFELTAKERSAILDEISSE